MKSGIHKRSKNLLLTLLVHMLVSHYLSIQVFFNLRRGKVDSVAYGVLEIESASPCARLVT